MTMPVRLIIFDLDGTLIDSVNDIADSLNRALEPFSLPAFAPGEVAAMLGDGALKLVQRALEKSGASFDPAPIAVRYAEIYAAHLVEKTTLYPGARETLEGLRAYRKALISNKSEALSRAILRSFGLLGYFDILVCADTIAERKPSPAPLLHVLSRLGIPPEEAIMVGDSEVDMTAGRAASVKTVALTHGYGRPGFETQGDFVVRSLPALLALIQEIDS